MGKKRLRYQAQIIEKKVSDPRRKSPAVETLPSPTQTRIGPSSLTRRLQVRSKPRSHQPLQIPSIKVITRSRKKRRKERKKGRRNLSCPTAMIARVLLLLAAHPILPVTTKILMKKQKKKT